MLNSISHLFDSNNDWIGYEYFERLSSDHTLVARYNNEGRLVSIRHTFENVSNGGSVREFTDYMNATKAKAFNANSDYFAESRALGVVLAKK